jgi:hypothetical protein
VIHFVDAKCDQFNFYNSYGKLDNLKCLVFTQSRIRNLTVYLFLHNDFDLMLYRTDVAHINLLKLNSSKSILVKIGSSRLNCFSIRQLQFVIVIFQLKCSFNDVVSNFFQLPLSQELICLQLRWRDETLHKNVTNKFVSNGDLRFFK